MERLDIKDISGNTLLSTLPDEGCKRKFTLMKEDHITLKFSLENPIYFKLGSYVECDFGLFEVCDLQKPAFNTDNAGYDYELQLDAHYWKWKNKIFKYTPETAGQEASWNLTAPLDVQAGIVLRNLKALGYAYKGQDFVFSIDSTVENKALLMTYDNINILDACFEMAKKWDCECWITENIIHFGRCESGDAVNFKIGVNVVEMSRSDSQSTYATRIYAFGSTKNIPSDYRPVDETVVLNGVVQKRLMLPDGTPYIDAYPDMTTEEAIEQVVIFDEVYPRRVGTMSDITTKEYTDKVENADGTTTEKKWNAYRFKDTGITFSKDYILPGEELKIIFQSGKLNGMEFAVTFDPDNKNEQLWEIVRNENYGRPLPDGVLIPENGDTYILSGWDSTKITELGLVGAAEQELKGEAEKAVAKSKIDPSTYNCKMMSDVAYSEDGVHNLYGIGQKVNLINKAYFENGRQSRVIGYEFNLDYPYDSPIYTVGETAAYSRIGDLEGKIESLTLKGQTYTGGWGSGVYLIKRNDSTPATDNNAFSALRSLTEFISKKKDDVVQGIITFMKGLRIGKFVTGMLGGRGASMWLDENGKSILEIDRILAREELIVPKITFNCIDVIAGDKANTFAYGTIKTVDREKRIATLDLLDDQWGTLHVNDICRGVFHNLEGSNEEQTLFDKNGFMGYSGFATSYFTPTRIVESKAGLMSFEYNLQVGTGVHPMPGMNFFAYGNFTDKERQSITYENRYYKRILEGVDTWQIDPDKHIMYQSGLLDGTTIGGMEMHGHGTFQKNGYMTGVHIQFTPDQVDQLTTYSVNLSSYEGVVTVDEEGNIINGAKTVQNVTAGGRNVIGGEENVVATGFRLSTRVQAFKGEKELVYSETLKAGAFMVSIEPVGCTAHVENGVVIVDGLTDLGGMSIGITVNCEGNASFLKTYTINVNQNGWNIISADLSNEMCAVHCDTYGNVLNGLPCTTVVSMWYGTRRLGLDRIEVEAPEGVSVSKDVETGVITVTAIPAVPGSRVITIPVRAYATFAGEQYSKPVQFGITKLTDGDPAVIYDLLPSESSIKKNSDGSCSVSSITCVLRKTDGKNAPVRVTVLPDGYAMMRKIDDGEEVAYAIGSPLSVTSAGTSITFSLYCNGQPVDRETIPVLTNGEDGKPGQDGKPGHDGEDGKPGEDACYYSISPAQMTIGQKITGSLDPSSFVCTCYKNSNNTQAAESAQWYIYRSNDNESWSQYATGSSYSTTFTVSVSSSYKYYKIVAKPFSNIECVAYAQIVSDGEDGDRGPQGPQGPAGDRGPSGSMPRYRGTYKSSETYVYNSEYRDIVIYNGNAYIVKPYGYSGSATPTNTSYWEQSNKFSFVAMDTALIDGANIAGFMFKSQKMQSQSGTLTLDGINGSIDARKGTIGGFALSNNSLSTTGSNASIKFEIDGYNFLRLNDPSSSAFLAARADGRTAASFSTYGTNNSSVALDLICNASGFGYALKSRGNAEIVARSGEFVRINGLALNAIEVSSSYTVKSSDDLIVCKNTSSITVSLPSSATMWKGKIVFIKPANTGNITMSGSIREANNRNPVGSTSIKDNHFRGFMYDGYYWNEMYLWGTERNVY